MPTNKNAMTRYALIDMMLANRHRAYSIQDITDTLAEKLIELGQDPVGKRCVEKDINYLEYDSPFSIELEEYWVEASDKNGNPYKKRCIKYADPTFSIFKSKLTEDEKSVLCTALNTLGSFDGLENFEWLNDLKHRLNLKVYEPIISISKNLLDNSTLIARLFTVIRLNQVITLNYHTFKDKYTKNVDIIPRLLKEYNNRWFLIASACDTGKILYFPLDRIDDFVYNYKIPFYPIDIDLNERFEEIIGISFDENQPIEKITFWVSNHSDEYIKTKPLHGSQKIIRGEKESLLRQEYPALKEGTFFQIECRKNYELIREFLSFMDALKVLSPNSLVKEMKDRIKMMAKLYN